MRRRSFALVWLLIAAALALLATLLVPVRTAFPGRTALEGPGPLVFAHRGGLGLWPENTLHAFREAVALGVDVLDLDLHASADGALVAIHDADVARTTDGTGAVSTLSLAALTRLDAGYDWTADAGESHPFRGRGIRIPHFADVLDALPGTRLNIELKPSDPAAGLALCRLLHGRDATGHTIVASVHQAVIDAFRSDCPEVATSATPAEATRFTLWTWLRMPALLRPRDAALEVVDRLGALAVATPRLVRYARELDVGVVVFTVNEEPAMRRLIDAGVAGIITDRPDRLLQALGRSLGQP